MPLSGSTVQAALAAVRAVGKQLKGFDELAAGADAALRQAPPGLTRAGAAAFLATCAVESAYFRTTTEYGKGQRYAPYIGRTFVQLTWEANYRGFGRWCRDKGLLTDPDQFVKAPASLSDYRWAWLGAVYFFEANGIWRWANAGNFRAVSQAVNGGNGRVGTSFTPNGWRERQAMYAVFHAVGQGLLPTPERPQVQMGASGPAVRDLRARFGLPAGDQFDQTLSVAVARFQRDRGLLVDGIVGPQTWKALG